MVLRAKLPSLTLALGLSRAAPELAAGSWMQKRQQLHRRHSALLVESEGVGMLHIVSLSHMIGAWPECLAEICMEVSRVASSMLLKGDQLLVQVVLLQLLQHILHPHVFDECLT